MHRQVNVARLIRFLEDGTWPEEACHTCNEPSCWNPAHIYSGSGESNRSDMYTARRHAHGEHRHNMTKLTDQKVREIRAMRMTGATYQVIADEYDIDMSHVGRIVRGEIWTHLL